MLASSDEHGATSKRDRIGESNWLVVWRFNIPQQVDLVCQAEQFADRLARLIRIQGDLRSVIHEQGKFCWFGAVAPSWHVAGRNEVEHVALLQVHDLVFGERDILLAAMVANQDMSRTRTGLEQQHADADFALWHRDWCVINQGSPLRRGAATGRMFCRIPDSALWM
ncbi:MAG: hypothetical protein EBS84_19105 [Proteobacteria bacterium]|nr:hypothetical protein [Pseudomonadota bacterium]